MSDGNSDGNSDGDFDLDRDFPLGDGSADVEATVRCPYCSEAVVISLDPGGGSSQQYVEDCEVCCNPWRLRVTGRGDSREIDVNRADGSE